jgi:ArsR family transcriptional regulator, lead/cadmium/zinc/bismuth-responsive transcriptional repressor
MPEIALKSVPPSLVAAEDDVCATMCVDEACVRAVAGRMPTETAITRVTDIFKILADPTRARIVFALSQAELCVCDLANLVGISVSAVSHQLRLLRSLGLVKFRKEGRLAYYTLNDQHVEQLLSDALTHVEHLHTKA